jgi:hypothetical protein
MTSVDEVVLPYLNELDRFIAVAHADSIGTLSGNFIAFLDNIVGWFGDRGVKRVTFITPRDDDDGDVGGPELLLPDERPPEGTIRAKWSGPKADFDRDETSEINATSLPEVQYLQTSAALSLVSGGGRMNWCLSPYAHRPSNKKLATFNRAMQRAFGPKYQSRLKKIMQDRMSRAKVRKCYDEIWSDHNLVSMAVYAGPVQPSMWQSQCKKQENWPWHWRNGQAVGWLGTGDMHLNVACRRRALKAHYQSVLDLVQVFGLPHHGSYRNFHASIVSQMPNMIQCVAASGTNGYGHPSPSVVEIVHSFGREFVLVNENGSSVLRWQHSA